MYNIIMIREILYGTDTDYKLKHAIYIDGDMQDCQTKKNKLIFYKNQIFLILFFYSELSEILEN